MPRQNTPASAAAAWARGLAGGPDAVAWLERAARLAPKDPRIVLDLARVRLAGGEDALAAAGFALVAAEYDAAAAWMGLALARHKMGDGLAAAAALGRFLARHCLPEGPGFAALAGDIAAAAGYDGFCGMAVSGRLLASQTEGRLLGAPLDKAALARVEGLVEIGPAGLSGWASRPAGAAPALVLVDAAGRRRDVAFGKTLPPDEAAPFSPRHGFRIPARRLRGLIPPFSLCGPDGAQIMGSPLDPAVLAMAPIAAKRRGPARMTMPETRPLAVVIPMYRGLDLSRACLESLFVALKGGQKIIVVDDATPEPDLAAWLDALAAAGRIELCRHAENRGFCAAVNTGLDAAGGHDVLLLNSDTLVPPGAIETLREVAYGRADTGSVTPFSNAAAILSYPDPNGGNAMPDLAGAGRLNALARQANGCRGLEIPTGVGFCMYLRHDCLLATGGFREKIFAQGYGEENDWCLRARHLGFRHRAALGAYVAHAGGVSFGAATHGLMARNLARLNRLYPGYHEMVLRFIAQDRLHRARARIDRLRARREDGRDAVLLISHSHGGGVARQVAAEMAALAGAGLRPLLLVTQFPKDPEHTPYPWPALLSESEPGDYPNLAFALPAQDPALLGLLRSLRVKKIVLHHTLGHHASVRTLAARLGLPQDIVVHDYASFCPRVNLLSRPARNAAPRYCGEPGIAGCVQCCKRDLGGVFEPLGVAALRARSAREFAAAERIVVPSADAARRMVRHFPGIRPQIRPWEDDTLPVRLTPPACAPRRRIVVVGGIGPSKGFDLLAACAQDAAARDLGLEFIVAGASADDARLLATGRIFITGAYAEGEALALIKACRADLAFLPSIWPETWCFALSEAWRAGLYTVAFDLGAQGERIRATGRGLALPLGLPVPRLNDILRTWTPEKRIG